MIYSGIIDLFVILDQVALTVIIVEVIKVVSVQEITWIDVIKLI